MATYFRHNDYVYYNEYNVLQSSVTQASEKSYETLTIDSRTVDIIENGTTPVTLFRVDGSTDYFYDWTYTKPKEDFVNAGCSITEIGQYPYAIFGSSDFVFKKDGRYYDWPIRMSTKVDATINPSDVTDLITDGTKAQVDSSNIFVHFEQVTPRILIKLGSNYYALNSFNDGDNKVILFARAKNDFFNSASFSTVYKTENEVYSTFPYNTDSPAGQDITYYKWNNKTRDNNNDVVVPSGTFKSEAEWPTTEEFFAGAAFLDGKLEKTCFHIVSPSWIKYQYSNSGFLYYYDGPDQEGQKNMPKTVAHIEGPYPFYSGYWLKNGEVYTTTDYTISGIVKVDNPDQDILDHLASTSTVLNIEDCEYSVLFKTTDYGSYIWACNETSDVSNSRTSYIWSLLDERLEPSDYAALEAETTYQASRMVYEQPVHFEPITLGDNEYFKYNNNYYSADNIQKHPVGNVSSITQLSLQVARNFANIPAFCYQENNNYYWFDDLGVDQTCFVADYVNKTLVKTMPATIFGDKLYYKDGSDWYYQAINAASASANGTLETNASNIEAAELGSSTNFTTLSLYNVSALDAIYLLDDISDKVYIADSLGHPVSYVCNNGVLFDLFYPIYKVVFADAAPSVSDGKMYVKSNDILTEASSYIIKTYSTLSAANADILNIDDGQAVIVKTDPNYQGNFGLYVNNSGTLTKVFQGGGSTVDIAYAVGDVKCFYDGSTIPEGWLPCDGSTFVQADYPLLYSFLGTNVLPDFTGRCIRGASSTTNVYSNNAGRSESNAATYEHKHPITSDASHTHNITSTADASHTHYVIKTGLAYSTTAGSISPAQRGAYGMGSAVASGGTVVTSSGPYIATVSVTGDLANNDVNSNETFINSANVLMYIKGTM